MRVPEPASTPTSVAMAPLPPALAAALAAEPHSAPGAPVVDMLERQPTGVLPTIEVQSKAPGATDVRMCVQLAAAHGASSHWVAQRDGFVVRHYATGAAVSYKAEGFLACNDTELPHDFDALLASRPSEALAREDIERNLRARLNNDPVLVPFLMKGLHRLKTGGFAWRFNVPVLQAALKDVVGQIDLSVNTLPALFVRGSESDYVGYDDLEELESHFLHMDHHTIDGAGHWLHAQSPDAFFEVTADFLS